MIRTWDYLRELPAERADLLAGIDKVLDSGRLILGESGKSFEAAFASYCGAKFGIGVDNATNAAFLAYKALGIGANPTDEVITSPLTAVPTASAIIAAGARPVFVDVDPVTGLLDTSLLAGAITSRTRAIVPVHLYGQTVDMDPLLTIAAANNIPVIEDAAQCHGARYKTRVAGSMGLLSTFSFYPTKPLATIGDGGMILTSDPTLDAKLRRLRYYGMERTYYAEEHGYNSRLDELHAEILFRRLTRLDANNERRRHLARRYDRLLAGTALTLPTTPAHNEHVFHLYAVRHRERDRILAALAERDIQLGIHYPWPLHTMRAYADLGYRDGNFPVAERFCREVFSLPMYAGLEEVDQDRVCDALQELAL